jgi:ketosteroid isomerase-like protein
MSTPLRTLIERNFAAVEAKDLEAVLQCFAEDAVFIDPHYPSPVMVGKAAIANGLRWAFKGMKQFGFTIVSYCECADGQHAAIEMATHHILQIGMQLQFPQSFFIDAQNDLITRIQAYEPYGPSGLVGLVLGVTRFQRRLRGQRSLRISDAPETLRR